MKRYNLLLMNPAEAYQVVIVFSLSLALTFLINTVYADTYYCNFARRGSNYTGTENDPWSIYDLNKHSYNKIKGGDIVECWGTGHDTIHLWCSGTNFNSVVTIRQFPKYKDNNPAILDFGSIAMCRDTVTGIRIGWRSYINIEGITVKNLGSPLDSTSFYVGIYVVRSKYITLTNCTVTNIQNCRRAPRDAKALFLHRDTCVTVNGGTYTYSNEGINIRESNKVKVSGATVHHTLYGTGTMKGFGIRITKENSFVTVSACTVSHAGVAGIYPSYGSHHILIENNKIHHTGITGILTEWLTHDIIVRGNTIYSSSVFYSPGEAGIWFADNVRGLCENNIVYDNPRGLWVSGDHNESSHIIVRNNIVYSNNNDEGYIYGKGGSVVINSVDCGEPDPPHLNWVTCYHNSLYFNGNDNSLYGSGFMIQEKNRDANRAHVDHIFIKNNIISEVVGKYVNYCREEANNPPATEIIFSNNYYFPVSNFKAYWNVNTIDNFLDWIDYHESNAKGRYYPHNPAYVNPLAGSLQLQPSSPCIDSATYLTTVDKVVGDDIYVENSKYFMDGYGIDKAGDIITIFKFTDPTLNTPRATYTIKQVDYDNDVLTVYTDPIKPQPGDYVIYALDKDGNARVNSPPDMGAYEKK